MASEWHGDATNGIEFRRYEDGGIDEVCMYVDGKCVLHIEQKSNSYYWMGLYGKTHDAHLNFGSSNSRSHVKFYTAEGNPTPTPPLVTSESHRLLPLVPAATKFQPYSPAEAATHLGRLAKDDHGEEFTLEAIRSSVLGINTRPGGEYSSVTYNRFAAFTWADTGEPCGTIE